MPLKLPIAVLAWQTPHGGGQAVGGVLDGLGVGTGVASGTVLEAVIAAVHVDPRQPAAQSCTPWKSRRPQRRRKPFPWGTSYTNNGSARARLHVLVGAHLG